MSLEYTITLCIYAVTLFIAYHAGKAYQQRRCKLVIEGIQKLRLEAESIMMNQRDSIHILENTIREIVMNPGMGPSNEIKMYFDLVNKQRKDNEKPKADNVVELKKE